MGSVSSVSVGTDFRENNEANQGNDEGNAVSLIGRGDGQNACQKVVKLQLNHSLNVTDDRLENPEQRRESMGITVQYLAEENVRLALSNQQLSRELQRLNALLENVSTESEDRDAIYGESLEQRLSRLEKHLASERQEKWSAIEKSERTRVDLVNRERELLKSNETIEKLEKELESQKSRILELEKVIRESKEKGSASQESQERENSLAEFREDLRAKRQARQRALSAISHEMNSLREELRKEKSERRRLEKELEYRKEKTTGESLEEVLSDNAALKNEISILSDNMEKLKDFSTENIRLKCEARKLNEEMDELNSSLGELKFEYYEEKRKHERTLKRLREMEESHGYSRAQHDWEEEKEKFYEKYDREKEEINKRTNALKEVISITKQMLAVREVQVQELKTKLKDIEESVKKSKVLEDNNLKVEYEKQLENIKNLRDLYEERVKLMEAEREKLHETLGEKTQTIKDQQEEIKNLTKEVESSREEVKTEKYEKESLEREFRLTIARTKDLENEINLINNLFTQMLLGPLSSGNETDLDKLTEFLQENHDLITEMTSREDGSEMASVLPKLLLDLITQVDGVADKKDDDLQDVSTCDTISEQSEGLLEENQGAVLPILSYKNAKVFQPHKASEEAKKEESRDVKMNEQISPAVQEIASNLPKVWRVLMELLSHHSAPEEPTPGDEKQCYKNVETPNGPRTVISVSKTFIRLKDLILEKKALQKELTRLKQLNSHLESRLDDQEKRLSQVQCELHKTWGIVGRMRAQHQQLHNHEKILRFELQEKRVMLSELKQELEYCRDKWERARQKNDESETEWKKLRREFAARKNKSYGFSSLNDSGESGFSDEQNESGEDFDADRSSTQSPVDGKLLEEPERKEIDLAEEIMKQSESNLKQARESIEKTKVEECTEVPTTQKTKVEECTEVPTTQKTEQMRLEEERARAREARDLRLKRLEEQCKLLVRQVDITTHKSNYLSNRLEELHEQYGSGEDRRPTRTSREQRRSSQMDEAGPSHGVEEEPTDRQEAKEDE